MQLLLMDNWTGQASIKAVIIIFLIAIFILFNIFRLPAEFSLIFTLALVIFIISFIKTDFALIILIFSMFFSPEIKIGAVTGRTVVLRADDIFLIVVFLGWLAKMAVNKELGFLKTTSLNVPILTYIFICIVSTFLGAARGYIKLHVSIFYVLKYFEYFLIFFMVTNNLKNTKQIKTLISCFILVCFVLSVYGWIQHFSGIQRVTAPFEGKAGEANTFGGYLILLIMVITGLLLNLSSFKIKVSLLVVLFFTLPTFLFTLSRGSWLGFIPASAALILLTKRGKLLLFFISIFVILLYPVILPNYVRQRIESTFQKGEEFTFLGKRVQLEESAAIRLETWKFAFRKWLKEPLIGYGVGSTIPVLDNQYARIIIEVGFLGLMAFVWLLISIYTSALSNYLQLKNDRFAQGITAGFIAGFIGLLVHAFSAETFIIIRIMEPFWFLAAIVTMLPEVYYQEGFDIAARRKEG